MNDQQREIFETTYDWLTAVIIKQNRLISFQDLWTAYPFKSNGLTKEGLLMIYSIFKKALN